MTANNNYNGKIRICSFAKAASIDVVDMYNSIPIELAFKGIKNELTALEINEILT